MNWRNMRRRVGVTLVGVLMSTSALTAETLTDALIHAYRNSASLELNRAVLRGVDEGVVQARANRKPQVSKLKGVRLLVGLEGEVPLVVSDRDGDAVSVNPDFTKGLFATVPEASFDQATNTLRWTPALNDVGKHTAYFFVSDGTVARKYRLKLQVKAPLYLP